MSKKKRNGRERRKQPGQHPLPPPGEGPHSKEDIFAWFAAHRIHAVVRLKDGKDTLFADAFPNAQPLPRSFYLVAHRYEEELTDLVKRSDCLVCIAPTDPTHHDSYHEDEQGRRYCYACQTYRAVSEEMRRWRVEEEASQTSHEQPAKAKPYFYVLPGDLQKVQLVAFTAAMENAFISYTTGKQLNATMGIPAMAVDLALIHERLVVNGKQGTNDPMKFREVFISVVPRVFPAMLTALEVTPEIVRFLESWDALERWKRLMSYAEKRLDLLKTPGDGPLLLD